MGSGRRYEGEERRDRDPLRPPIRAQAAEVDRQPERDEGDDLGECRKPFLEHLDLALERRFHVSDEQACDEHRQEPRAVGDRRDAVDDPREGERAHRVETGRRQREPAQEPSFERGRPRSRSRGRCPSARRRRGRRPRRSHQRGSRARSAPASARSRPGRWRPTRPRGSCRCGRRSRGRRRPRTSPPGRSARPLRRCRPDVSQPSPNAQWTNTATSPAVANVPTTPSETIGTADARKRRRPIEEPPSKRITINATVARRSTVSNGRRSAENASEATAAATRKSAAEGTEIRALSLAVSSASESAPATNRMSSPKWVTSCISPA